jgi:hypothetical protein
MLFHQDTLSITVQIQIVNIAGNYCSYLQQLYAAIVGYISICCVGFNKVKFDIKRKKGYHKNRSNVCLILVIGKNSEQRSSDNHGWGSR